MREQRIYNCWCRRSTQTLAGVGGQRLFSVLASTLGAGSWDPVIFTHGCRPLRSADQDGAEPSANSVSAHNLLRLHGFTGHKDWMEKCVRLLTAFSERMRRVPVALPEMVRALLAHQQTLKQVRGGEGA